MALVNDHDKHLLLKPHGLTSLEADTGCCAETSLIDEVIYTGFNTGSYCWLQFFCQFYTSICSRFLPNPPIVKILVWGELF